MTTQNTTLFARDRDPQHDLQMLQAQQPHIKTVKRSWPIKFLRAFAMYGIVVTTIGIVSQLIGYFFGKHAIKHFVKKMIPK